MNWQPDDILGYAVVIALIIIPALAFTARFALKPIVESMLRIRESLDRGRPPAEDPRLLALEERVAGMQETLDRVAAAVEFDASLRAGPEPPRIPAAPAPRPHLVRPAPEAASATPRAAADPEDYEQEYL